MDINQVLQSHGVLGGGGSSGVKKIYSLTAQANEPQNPKPGNMWVKPLKTVTKTTVSLNFPANPIDGEILIQVDHVVYEMNFEKLSSKIEGNINTNIYVFNVDELTRESINNNFIPLFQKDVVKEYAILKGIYQYNSDINEWEVPDAYYYNGTYWVNVAYKLFIQYEDKFLNKITPETLNVSGTVTINDKIFQVNPDGTYYGKSMVNYELVVTKYDRLGNTISITTIGRITHYPNNIHFVDHFGNFYVNFGSTQVNGFTRGRFLRKISPNGDVLWVIDSGIDRYFDYLIGANENYLIYKPNVKPLIINMNTGNFTEIPTTFANVCHNIIFEDDGFYILFDTSSSTSGSGFKIHKYSYEGALLKEVSVPVGEGWKYIEGMVYIPSPRLYIFKDLILPDTFIVVYHYANSSSAIFASINKFTCNLANNTVISIYKNVIPKATTDYNTKKLKALNDIKNNIYITWDKTLFKYREDGIEEGKIVWSKSFISQSNTPNDDLFVYARE